ncbi:MAG: DUF3443 family protein [Gammaproteobacteria bacterium]|nr:DUF3443 family protein [Gammaproteobacteria bacterium]
MKQEMKQKMTMSQIGVLSAILGCTLLGLVGCGGGGGGNQPQAVNNPTTTIPTAPTPVQSAPTTSIAAAANVANLTIDAGPAAVTPPNTRPSIANLMYTTVTLCMPGTQTCTSVDHVLVDTGSSGLRVFASALPTNFTLPQRVDVHNNPLAECIQFVDGYSWGPLQTADLRISGETANSLPIQVIGSSNFSTVPTACSNTGTARNTVQSFAANGILGIGNGAQDCGSGCVATNLNGTAQNNLYYSCPTPQTCTATTVPVSAQVQNPITLFAVDNNGSAIVFPTIPSSGALSVNGYLVFGIGTQNNNGLGSASVLTVDSPAFELTTQYGGASYTESYIDSGTNFFAVPNSNNAITVCSGNASSFFCPASTLNLSATLVGRNAASSTTSFSIANAINLFNQNAYNTAFSNLGGPSGSATSRTTNTFAWGSPFFFGKTVYTAIEGKVTPSSTPTPYVAFF